MARACETSDGDVLFCPSVAYVTDQQTPHRALHRLRRLMLPPPRLPPPVNPALLKHAEHEAEDAQNRVADAITRFAGSMTFVYLHVIWFACWIGFGVEDYPYGLLTMIVSLEAIFLSTFVMISQNRAAGKQQVIADEQWMTVQEEDRQNRELLDLSNQILVLTKEVHAAAQRNGRLHPPFAKTTTT
jgi:uncharacterized membrane protein